MVTGTSISHYKILEKLGEGGMGVVYKATDTKLDRTVALKFLAAHLLNDGEAKQRFLREAKASAALHHPNICTVYEVDEAEGKTFLAMALLQGEALEDRIAQGPLPLKDALEIGRQVAEGLEAAHEKGIVHRDVKPANIMVDAKARATIMDFGLARLTEASKLTRQDQTVGTAAYMSPEQIQGLEVDQRTDIWALGCVLYEMVTGLRPFKGQYDQALAYEIVHEEPEPLTAVRAGVPMELEFIVSKCLAKEAADRYHHASEITVDLRTLSEKLKSGRSTVLSAGSVSAGVRASMMDGREIYPAQTFPGDGVVTPKGRLRALQATAVVLGLAALAGAAAYFGQGASPEARVTRRFSFAEEGLQVGAISPDGRYIAYISSVDDRRSLWLRSLEDETSRRLPGTEGAFRLPIWSPDSLSIAFGASATRELKRVPVDGGEATVLCELSEGRRSFNGGAWSPDGERIVFASGEGLHELDARGGRPRLLLESEPGMPAPRDPIFVPTSDGSPVLVYAAVHGGEDIRLKALDLKGSEPVELGPGKDPAYSPEGYLIHGPGTFVGDGLFAAPFAPEKLELTGPDFLINSRGSQASFSWDGAMSYSEDGRNVMAPKTLVWRNRSGEILEKVGQPQLGLREFALSPDGRWVATTADEPSDVWVHDLVRSTVTRLSTDPENEYLPSWTASGREIAYTLANDTETKVMLRSSDGTGEALQLTSETFSHSTTDWSRDGRYVVFNGNQAGQRTDIFYVDLDEPSDARKPNLLVGTSAAENTAKFSPDGRFVAYVSNESGKAEVYVIRFPSGVGRLQASVNGGKQPRWSRDGKELYYVEDDTRLMAVSVSSAENVSLGRPKKLFESDDLDFRNHTWPQYDVSADGRFLTSTLVDPQASPTIRVVLHWFEPFRDRD